MKKTILILSGFMLMLTSLIAVEVRNDDELDCVKINVRTEAYSNNCEGMCAQSEGGVMELCDYLMDKGRSVRYSYLVKLNGMLDTYNEHIKFLESIGKGRDEETDLGFKVFDHFAQKRKELEMFFEMLVSHRASLNDEVRESFRHLVYCLTYPICGSEKFTTVSTLFDDVLVRMNVTKEEVMENFHHPIMKTVDGDL